MGAPRWARWLVRRLAPEDRADDVLGDLEEAHAGRTERHSPVASTLLTSLEALDVAFALVRERLTGHGVVSWLDFKLGLRMLVKHPGLTLVGAGAIAFAIALGVGTFEFLSDFLFPRLPLDEADRIVEIRGVDPSAGRVEPRILHEYLAWREELASVEDIGAFASFQRTLLTEGRSRVLTGAATTASAFAIARVPPLLGRPLLASDDAPGAPPVAVLGYDAWSTMFDREAGVIGRTVRLGPKPVTIVGVMPEGFGWPWAHGIWTPLRVDALGVAPGEGPPLRVVARLSDGVSLEEARAELAAIGLRDRTERGESHEYLRPQIERYGRMFSMAGFWESFAAYSASGVFFGMLILLVCGNVGLLLFARTAARGREIVVRTALGASRGRIVVQLFVEALVLGVLATTIGLWAAHRGLGWVLGMFDRYWADEGQQMLGFWFDARLSARAVAYALAWALVAAVISGVLPALKTTGRQVQRRLQHAGSGGSSLEFGRLWTAVIVAQVAVTVAFVPVVIVVGGVATGFRNVEYGFPAEEYLTVELAADREVATSPEYDVGPTVADERYRSAYAELRRRVVTELGRAEVTLVGELPGARHQRHRVDVQGPDGFVVRASPETAHVDADFFDVVGAPFLSGRGFTASDLDPDSRVAIVNEAFVDEVLGGRDAVGRRLSFVRPGQDLGEPRDWYRIVGVVRQIAVEVDLPDFGGRQGLYLPLSRDTYPVRMAVHVGSDPLSLAPRLRRLAFEVDPELQIAGIRPMDESAYRLEMTYTAWFRVVLAAGGGGLLLANAGLFAIMSFTVSRRTREIGVRVALGADRRRIVWGVFSRTLKQVGLGVLLGGLIFLGMLLAGSELLFRMGPGVSVRWVPGGRDAGVLVLYLVAMLAACLTAGLGPVRRALGVQPTDALREEG